MKSDDFELQKVLTLATMAEGLLSSGEGRRLRRGRGIG